MYFYIWSPASCLLFKGQDSFHREEAGYHFIGHLLVGHHHTNRFDSLGPSYALMHKNVASSSSSVKNMNTFSASNSFLRCIRIQLWGPDEYILAIGTTIYPPPNIYHGQFLIGFLIILFQGNGCWLLTSFYFKHQF